MHIEFKMTQCDFVGQIIIIVPIYQVPSQFALVMRKVFFLLMFIETHEVYAYLHNNTPPFTMLHVGLHE